MVFFDYYVVEWEKGEGWNFNNKFFCYYFNIYFVRVLGLSILFRGSRIIAGTCVSFGLKRFVIIKFMWFLNNCLVLVKFFILSGVLLVYGKFGIILAFIKYFLYKDR